MSADDMDRAKGLEMMALNKRQDTDEQAAQWVANLLSGDKRVNVGADLADWRAESAANAKAFDELLTMAASLDEVAEAALEEEWTRELEAAAEERRRQRWIVGISSVAAGIVVAAVMSVSMLFSGAEPITYETLKGQRSTIALEDGSMLQLNTDTRVTAWMEDDLRHVAIERGEAFFEVKRDEDRPFLVDAGKTQVRVLGTKFNVRLGASSNIVSVLSGLVSVSQREGGDDIIEMARLHGGEQAEHDTARHEAMIEDFDTSAVMAWRTGKALYQETPLVAVVADLNRYFDAPLEIADASIENLPVTGTFNLTDQNVVIDALESAFSLMAVKRMDGVILLYPKQS